MAMGRTSARVSDDITSDGIGTAMARTAGRLESTATAATAATASMATARTATATATAVSKRSRRSESQTNEHARNEE